MQGVPIRALVDSGVARNVVSSWFFKKLARAGLTPELRPAEERSLLTASSAVREVKGEAQLKVEF